MMKSWKLAGMLAMLMMMMCLAGQAAAGEITEPAVGLAVVSLKNADDAAALYAEEDEKSDVLMNYLCGTLVTVEELTDGDMAKVFVGSHDVGLSGYMKKDELAYGARAVRETPGTKLYVLFGGRIPVYASCDEQAEVIGWADEMFTHEACGAMDGWAQLSETYVMQRGYSESSMEYGFVRVEDAQVNTAYIYDNYSYLVLPIEGELTYEQAYERAIELALQNPEWLVRLSEDQRTEEFLRSMRSDVRLGYNVETGKATWDVTFEAYEVSEECNAIISMEADGTLIDIWAGNG